jgi:hypothetical protein
MTTISISLLCRDYRNYGCASLVPQSFLTETLNVPLDFLTGQDEQPEKLVESVETFDETVG